jgi:ParB/RepB/Spo0J family partition protein
MVMTLTDIRLDQIKEQVAPPDPHKRGSIERIGIQSPVVLYLNETGYEVISGKRRVAEAITLGLDTIPAIVKDKPSAEDKAWHNLADNLARSYNYIDEAGDLLGLIESGLSQQEIAQALGISQGLISQRINLIKKLIPALVEAMRQGRMKMAAARIAQKLGPELQERLAEGEGSITSPMAQALLNEQNQDFYDLSDIDIPDLSGGPAGYTLTEADLLTLERGQAVIVVWGGRELVLKGETI